MRLLASGLLLLASTGGLNAQDARFIGAGGCSGSNCHGGTAAASEKDSRIWGNEYAIWSLNDKHSKAYQVLSEPRSKRMAEVLRIANAQTEARCTVCHAVGSTEKSRSDGVACEACHGAAEKWLGPHTQTNSHASSVAAGMTDTKVLHVRAGMCLGCHLGTKDKVVDHELIAAGHPDLNFELDTFGWAQPAHYREVRAAAGKSLPRVRVWAVGQAAALAEGMRMLAQRAGRNWPEFSELECYQCHHELRLDSWRIQRGYGGRKPGSLQVNTARTEVVRVLVAQAAPEQRNALDGAINQVAAAVANQLHDGSAIAQAAARGAQQGDALVARFEKQDFTAEQARGIVRALAADIPRIASSGVNAAEVATMSLDSLIAAITGNSPSGQAAMTPLYDFLEHPSTFQPMTFVALFRKAAGAAN
jgi:hypothetical protein